VKDDAGRESQLSNLLINYDLPDSKGNNGIGTSMNTGYFVLHFDTGSGMELPTDLGHIERRNVMSKVFQDISSLIMPTNNTNLVHLHIRDFSNFVDAPSSAISASSSYFIIPNQINIANGDILDGAVYQTINSGKDAYSNLANPYSDFGQPLGSTNYFYHGFLSFNFAQNWHCETGSLASSNSIDLYSVALKEMLKVLGLTSLIDDNGNSRFGNTTNYFSRYDKFCVSESNQSYLVNSGDSEMGNYIWNTLLNAGTYLHNNYNNSSNTIHYNTTLENGIGSTSNLRSPAIDNIEALCSIGYNLGSTFGNAANLNETNYSASCNTPNVVSAASDCYNTNGEVALTGVIGEPLYFNGLSILANDSPLATFQNLQIIIGSGVLNFSSGDITTNITYTPEAAGYHVLRYIAVKNGMYSNYAYVVVKIIGGGCIEEECQLLNNGEFEIFDGNNCNWNNLTSVSCWSFYCASPDLLSPDCAGTMMEFPTGTVNPAFQDNIGGDGISSGNVLGLSGNTNAINSTFDYQEECVQQPLNQALVPNEQYQLNYVARVITAANNSTLRVRSVFDDNNPATSNNPAQWNVNPFTEIFPLFDVPNDGIWHSYSEIAICPNVNNLNRFLIGTDPSTLYGNSPTGPIGGIPRYVIIDNIELRHIDDRILQFPTINCTPVNWTNLMNFVFDASTNLPDPTDNGEFTINGVALGEGIYNYNTNLSGIYVIEFSYIDEFHTCQLITQSVTITATPDISLNSSTQPPICIGNAFTLMATEANNIPCVYSWTPINFINPDIGAAVEATLYGNTAIIVTATNGSCSDQASQYFTTSICPPPTITPTITNCTCYNSCDGTISLSALNPFTVVWSNGSTTPTISGLCAGTYSATISMTGYSTVTINYVVNNPSYTALYNGNLLPISNVTTWQPFNVICDQDIIIENGGVLNMTNGLNNIIKFTPGHGIIIKPGGTLKANFTLFTSTCGDWWKGISCQASSQTVRGLVQLIAGCVVEKAIHGIMNHDGIGNGGNRGGKIEATNMTFRNNDRDVELKSFLVSPSIDYGANFYGCSFIINNNALAPLDQNNFRVELNTNGRVNFVGCHFDNQNNAMLTSDHMKAID
jgi:hypothetical protein